MAWERFDRVAHSAGKSRSSEPRIGLNKTGVFTLNKAAFKALGEPEAVVLLFDQEAGAVAFRAAERSDPNSYAVTRLGKTTTRTVRGRALLKYYGVDYSKARQYAARMVNGMLVATLRPNDSTVSEGRRLRAVS